MVGMCDHPEVRTKQLAKFLDRDVLAGPFLPMSTTPISPRTVGTVRRGPSNQLIVVVGAIALANIVAQMLEVAYMPAALDRRDSEAGP